MECIDGTGEAFEVQWSQMVVVEETSEKVARLGRAKTATTEAAA